MTTRKNHVDRKTLRQTAAKERQSAWSALTVAEQIASLDRRLGAGKGAQRQRERLAK
jgi:hypothetical protein